MNPLNLALDSIRSAGELLGYQLAVEVSDHSIDIQLEKPNHEQRAWDTNLYSDGNLFVEGYANPIKPRVEYNEDLENPDTIDVEDGDPDEHTQDFESERHVELISSPRYRDYMRQDLISQILTPDTRWKLLAYAVGVVAFLVVVNVMVSLSAAGVI
jgi:hypothetical protein